jgi:hypothetical protein
VQAASSFTVQGRLLTFSACTSLSTADHFLGFLINPSCSDIVNRLRISRRNCGIDKFFGSIGKMDGFFITAPCVLVAYILSNLGFICLFFEHISVNTSPPFNGPKLLGGGWVGVRFPAIDKGWGVLRLPSRSKPLARRMVDHSIPMRPVFQICLFRVTIQPIKIIGPWRG